MPSPLAPKTKFGHVSWTETWLVRVAEKRVLAVFDNDSIHRILYARQLNRHHIRLTRIPGQLVQRRLYWLVHTARRPEGELIYFCPHRLARGESELEAT